MESQVSIESLLKRALEAEMTIRSLTTKVQHIREAQAQLEAYKKQWGDARLELFLSKTPEAEKQVANLKGIVDALDYLLVVKASQAHEEINADLESLNWCVSRLPKKIDRTILYNQ